MTKKLPYATAASFEQAINHKIRDIAIAKGNQDLPRIRRQIAFERLLARLFEKDRKTWILKGGYAMELRLNKARATKDMDLCLRKPAVLNVNRAYDEVLLSRLQEEAAQDLGDFFSFIVPPSKQKLLGPEFRGSRFQITAELNGKPFARFHLDVSIADPILEPVEILSGKNWLSFAGLPSQSFPSIAKEQQFAEKIHAYTKPRKTGYSSRVRDLVDLVLFLELSGLDPKKVRAAIDLTFSVRNTHAFPDRLQKPHQSWEKSFPPLAQECELELDLASAFGKVQSYLVEIGLQKKKKG